MVLTQWSITSVRSGQLTGLAFGHAGARRRYYAVAIRCELLVMLFMQIGVGRARLPPLCLKRIGATRLATRRGCII